MKRLLLLLLAGAALRAAAMAPVGSPAPDLAFSTGTAVSNGQFTSLTNSMLSAHEGKIIVLAYYTPW
jgi:hypothetical protein